MNLILKYFWFLAVIGGFLNYMIMKPRIIKYYEDQAEIEESKRFLRNVISFFTIPFLYLGFLQIFGNFDNLFFIFSGQYRNVYVVLSWLLFIYLWGSLLYWVFIKNGITMIIKYRKIFNNMPEDETLIKILLVIMVLAGAIVLIAGNIIDLYSISRTIR